MQMCQIILSNNIESYSRVFFCYNMLLNLNKRVCVLLIITACKYYINAKQSLVQIIIFLRPINFQDFTVLTYYYSFKVYKL